jgi:glyoxylase-like metal-dependent hydrolase (beta-lactamase superfamily II)
VIKTSTIGPITRFDLTRPVPGLQRYWTTAYWVDGLLVDSGCAHAAPQLLAELAGKPLQAIVNTHSHEDHIGANGPLQRRQPELRIWAHPLALPVLEDPRHRKPLHPYRRLFWGWPTLSSGTAVTDGQVIRTSSYCFQVIFTPGHSPDHLCLYEAEQGWLFSGDLFVGGQDRAMRQGTDVWGIIASLERLETLNAAWLFPGSARARQQPQAEISAKIAYYRDFGERVQELDRQGLPFQQIVDRLCGPPTRIERITLSHFARRHLVQSYLDRAIETKAG